MINERLTELVNKYIDKELTEIEKSELDDLLKNSDNKSYFVSMVDTIEILENSKLAFDNTDIKRSVINEINNQRENKMTNNAWWSQLFKGSKVGYAFSFALGALLVALVFMLQPNSGSVNDEFMTGTMTNRNFDNTYFLNEQSFDGAIKVKRSQDVIILDVELKTSESLDCELKYNNTEFSLFGVKSIDSNNGKFASGLNLIRLSDLGSNHYMVFLRNLQNIPGKVYAIFYKDNMKLSNLTIDIKS